MLPIESERCMMKVELGTLLPDPENPLWTKKAPVRFCCGNCDINEELLFALGRPIQADTPEELMQMLEAELQDPQSTLAKRVEFTKGQITSVNCKRNPFWEGIPLGVGKF